MPRELETVRAVTQPYGGVDDVDVMLLLLLLLEKNCKDETLQKRRTFAYSLHIPQRREGGSRVEVALVQAHSDLEFESLVCLFSLFSGVSCITNCHRKLTRPNIYFLTR